MDARAIRSETPCVFRGRFHPYRWKGQLAESAEAGAQTVVVLTQSDTWDDRIHPEWWGVCKIMAQIRLAHSPPNEAGHVEIFHNS